MKSMHPSPPSGIDALILEPGRRTSLRWALVTNDAALTSTGEPVRQALLKTGFRIVRLFSPEHGISAKGNDGERQADGEDPLTGLPVFSLYGDGYAPTSSLLDDIDAVLYDIPDVGCRFYTYLWTMTHVMEACAREGKPLVVADRRNPIGTDLSKAEGPWLNEDACASLLGRWNIPLKHACTMGELARFFAATRVADAELEVLKIPSYRRADAGIDDPFTPTSPAMHNLQSALVYPGLCLLEGVNVNEGRGTDLPFARFGAPWLDAERLMESIDRVACEGIRIHSEDFQASSEPYQGVLCKGIRLEVTEPSVFMGVRFGISLLKAIQHTHGDRLRERPYPTHANPTGSSHLDRLLGVRYAFERIVSDSLPETDVSSTWRSAMEPHLLYR
jgi:uncharacterized protein YbbC (DUF1343 family)